MPNNVCAVVGNKPAQLLTAWSQGQSGVFNGESSEDRIAGINRRLDAVGDETADTYDGDSDESLRRAKSAAP